MNIPKDLHYTKDHEWVRIEGDVATIGITDFAQKELGDIVFVEANTVLPIAGEILELNGELDGNPELVNTDPYGKGWMVKVKLAAGADKGELLAAAAYEKLIG